MSLCAALKVDPKPLMRAAVAERGAVTLVVEPDRVNVAASIAVAWPAMTTVTLERIAKVISEAKHG
jgi:hypothetical protein